LPELSEALQKILAIILDMDGVIYLGKKPIKGAAKAVAYLRRSGKKMIFLTNNSENTRRSYVEKLARMGIPVTEDEIVTSGQMAADYIKSRNPKARVFTVGGEGLTSEMKLAGLKLVPPEKATHLVVGMDRNINYEKLTAGMHAIMAGAEFIATNVNNVYPTEKGLTPGAGAIVGALVGSTKKRPEIVVGKPSPLIIRFGLRILGTKPSETAIIGDRIDVDIKVGKRVGLTTILVLSGISKKGDLKKILGTKMAPDFVIDSLSEVMD